MRGGEGGAIRAYNERLIIGAIRAAGPLSKADIARATGLSAQAASVIVNALLDEKVLAKRPKLRGLVGQPQTPIALNPAGAYAVGLKIGRRSVEGVLVDFLGAPLARERADHAAPFPGPAMAAAEAMALRLIADAPRAARGRLAGVGVAIPGDMHEWAGELGLPAGALDGWRGLDVAGRLAAATGLDVTAINDATAACAAELALGHAIAGGAALYLYLGAFAGGGLVIDGRLHRGGRGNAGALGSMPMVEPDEAGRPRQLIHEASVILLDRALEAEGLDAAAMVSGRAEDPRAEAAFARWAGRAAPALARAAVAAASVVDVETVVVDGVLNPRWRAGVTQATAAALGRFNRAGLSPFAVVEGSVGEAARVLGAAMLPLQMRYAPSPDLLARAPRASEPRSGEPRAPEPA